MGVGLDLKPPSRISDPMRSDSARLMWVDLPVCKHGRDCDIHFQFLAENFNPINMLATGRLDGKVKLSAVMSCISIPLRLFEPCLGYWFGRAEQSASAMENFCMVGDQKMQATGVSECLAAGWLDMSRVLISDPVRPLLVDRPVSKVGVALCNLLGSMLVSLRIGGMG